MSLGDVKAAGVSLQNGGHVHSFYAKCNAVVEGCVCDRRSRDAAATRHEGQLCFGRSSRSDVALRFLQCWLVEFEG